MSKPARNDLSCADIRSRFHYDQESGILTWRVSSGSVAVDKVAGCKNGNGYLCVRVNRRLYLVHRLVWLYVHGEWPAAYVDHSDGDKTNNRISNLRQATRSENLRNATRKGFYKSGNQYFSSIRVDGKNRYLGRFSTPEEARAAYLAATKIHFGEFSVTSRGPSA